MGFLLEILKSAQMLGLGVKLGLNCVSFTRNLTQLQTLLISSDTKNDLKCPQICIETYGHNVVKRAKKFLCTFELL